MREPILGIAPEEIAKAEAELQVKFPGFLREAWQSYNVIELRGGWFVFPIFDQRNPRKTASNIVYENTKGRWEIMPDNLLAIANNGSGNQLVVKVTDGIAGEKVFHWQHDTGSVKTWKPGAESILESARRSRASVQALIQKYGTKKD